METNWGETHAELTKKIKYLAVDTVRYFSSLVKKEAGEGRPTFHRGYDWNKTPTKRTEDEDSSHYLCLSSQAHSSRLRDQTYKPENV